MYHIYRVNTLEMYRIKDDRRILSSADKICNGLKECLKDRELSNISISEVTEKSGISRATFYRLFDTPVDVMAMICDNLASKAAEGLESVESKNMESLLSFMIEFLMNHSDTLECLLRSGRTDLLYSSFKKPFDTITKNHIQRGFTETEAIYARESIAAVLCSILFVWISNGKRESLDELLSLFRRAHWKSFGE